MRHPLRVHSLLLCIHVPNNDRLFPGRQEIQVADFGESEPEWQVECILSHIGSGPGATFELRWTSGDVTWMSYDHITHLTALTEYLDLLDVKQIDNLLRGTGSPPSNDLQIYSTACHLQLHNSSTPYPTMRDCQKKPPRQNQRSNFQNIEARGENFVFIETDGQEYLVMHEQLKLYLKYGCDLHSQMGTDPDKPTPLGYNLMAAVFNEKANNPYQMAQVSANGLLEPVSLLEPLSTLFFSSAYNEDREKLENTADFKKMGTTLVNRMVQQELNIQAERERKAKIRAQEGVGVREDLPAGRKERRMGEGFGLQDDNHRDGRKRR